jgi:voltage-gated potassium channel
VTGAARETNRRATRRHLLRVAARVAIFTAALTALYVLAPLGRRPKGFIALELALSLIAFVAIVAWEIREIFRSPYPAIQAIEAVAISIPMLILMFSAAYVELARESSGSFSEPLTRVDALYFSVTVFATVGFGDIAAVSETARIIVTFQMLSDLVLVGFIAKVLFGAVQQRRQTLGAQPAVPEQGRGSEPAADAAPPPASEPVIPPG